MDIVDKIIVNYNVGTPVLSLFMMKSLCEKNDIKFMKGPNTLDGKSSIKSVIKWIVNEDNPKINEKLFISHLKGTINIEATTVVISLSINNSHSNIIMINKKTNTFEYFEPNYPFRHSLLIQYFYDLCNSVYTLKKVDQPIINLDSLQDKYGKYINRGWCDLICFIRILNLDPSRALPILLTIDAKHLEYVTFNTICTDLASNIITFVSE